MTHTDKQFLESLQAATGRDVRFGNFRCDMCGGHGFSALESICTQCYGEGFVTEPYFADCDCRVDKDDNPDCEECFPESIEIAEVASIAA